MPTADAVSALHWRIVALGRTHEIQVNQRMKISISRRNIVIQRLNPRLDAFGAERDAGWLQSTTKASPVSSAFMRRRQRREINRKASARLSPLFALFWKTCTSPTNDTSPAPTLGLDDRGARGARSWSATRPARRSAIFYFDDQPPPTIDHRQAHHGTRRDRMAANLAKLLELLRRLAADKRNVTRSQPQILRQSAQPAQF